MKLQLVFDLYFMVREMRMKHFRIWIQEYFFFLWGLIKNDIWLWSWYWCVYVQGKLIFTTECMQKCIPLPLRYNNTNSWVLNEQCQNIQAIFFDSKQINIVRIKCWRKCLIHWAAAMLDLIRRLGEHFKAETESAVRKIRRLFTSAHCAEFQFCITVSGAQSLVWSVCFYTKQIARCNYHRRRETETIVLSVVCS